MMPSKMKLEVKPLVKCCLLALLISCFYFQGSAMAVCTSTPYDYNYDDRVDGLDLAHFAAQNDTSEVMQFAGQFGAVFDNVGLKTVFYRDSDGDGHGDNSTRIDTCSAPVGYITDGTDCNDSNPAINILATEVNDGVDNNCDSLVDEVTAVIDSTGGTVETPDGVTLEIPAGSLTATATITLALLPEEVIAALPAEDNSQFLNAVDFGPDGLVFGNPIKATFPLKKNVAPGTVLPLYLYDEALQHFTDSGATCTVAADGSSCTGEISHFSTYCPAIEAAAKYIWQIRDDGKYNATDAKGYLGEYAYFVRMPTREGSAAEGYCPPIDKDPTYNPRLPNSGRDTPEGCKSVAVRLYGSVPQTNQCQTCFADKEPVLFIHGYQPLNDFGGEPGYWGGFIKMVNELKIGGRQFVSFDFQWRTNARFEDVAEDLYYAVNKIHRVTGKRVHIVAHSFGGVLARVLLQKYAGTGSENNPLNADLMVASLTTLGTPHSGIFDKETNLDGIIDFPGGQDSWTHEWARQISVHQMGEAVSFDEDLKGHLGLVNDLMPGEMAFKLAVDDHFHQLPANLPIQVGIGLNVENNVLSKGDSLISFEGQRFHPHGINDDMMQNTNKLGARVTEFVLGKSGNDEFYPGVRLYYDEDYAYFYSKYPSFLLGFVHSEGAAKASSRDFSFYENIVDNCTNADSCTHASFVAVKDWLTRYSSAPTGGSTFHLPDTGQTKCYNDTQEITCPSPGQPFYGQDANYNINLSYNDNHDGTVTDNITGLMWQQNNSEVSIDCPTCDWVDPDAGRLFNWYQAAGFFEPEYNPTTFDVCKAQFTGGHSDWRLPTEKELVSIVDYNRVWPNGTANSIFTTSLEGTDSSQQWSSANYWSSTAYPESYGRARIVDFSSGSTNRSYRQSEFAVRCVRGEQTFSNYTANNGTVTDHRTGLVWQQQDDGQLRSWEEAIAYCEGFSLPNQDEWRLPNIKELQSITENERNVGIVPPIDPIFTGAKPESYWSSTTALRPIPVGWPVDGKWTVYFGSGYVGDNWYGENSYSYTRCVSGGQ